MLRNKVIEFNAYLAKFLATLTYCQHDSDYWIKIKETEKEEYKQLIKDMNQIFEDIPSFKYDCVLYCTWKKRTEYIHTNKDQFYAISIKCIEKATYEDYCKRYNLNPENFLIKTNKIAQTSEFHEHMNKLVSSKESDYHNSFRIKHLTLEGITYEQTFDKLNLFQIVDTEKLSNAISAQ